MIKSSASKSMAGWLFMLTVMVFAMTVLGGITRLTGSGLSMVQWAPILGWLPPQGSAEWEAVFAAYRTSPEYNAIHPPMDLAGFQNIFWLEYFHRLLGRLIGVAFLVPFLYFLARGQIVRAHVPRLASLFALGGAQGLMGWYMVQSGLVDEPHISHYRLAAHLGLGVVIFASLLWTALDFYDTTPNAHPTPSRKTPYRFAATLLVLVFITIVSGALVAGTHAGLAFNSFPLMEGRWIPETYGAMQPLWINAVENIAAIQWNHRFLALLVLGGTVLFWFFFGRHAPRGSLRVGGHLLLGMGILQVVLGISTLLLMVPVALASAHQAGAMILFGLLLFNVHQWRTMSR